MCLKIIATEYLLLHTDKRYMIFFFLLSSFWLCAGWYTLHCLRKREYFFPLTYTLDLFAAALHVHKCTKVHLDFDPQLLSVIVYVSIKSLFTIETIQLKSVKVLKSWKIPTEQCWSILFNHPSNHETQARYVFFS